MGIGMLVLCVCWCDYLCVLREVLEPIKKLAANQSLPFLTNRDLSTLMFICQQIRLLCSALNFVQDGFHLELIMNSCHFFLSWQDTRSGKSGESDVLSNESGDWAGFDNILDHSCFCIKVSCCKMGASCLPRMW